MATKTETAVHDLTTEIAVLKEQVRSLREELDPLRETVRQIAVIEHQLSEMTKTKELWGQRGWMVLTICLSAFFSLLTGVLGVFLSSYLKK